MERVRTVIATGLHEQLGLDIEDVECPERRELLADDEFECIAKTAGVGRLVVEVRQTDGSGAIAWEVRTTSGLIDPKRLAELITTGIRVQTGQHVQVDCGDAYRVSNPGDAFRCLAEAGGSVPVEVEVVDEVGNVNWRVN